ncbi:MAG: hypothetical protein K0R94_144 [Burkholderiales bacterium]|jgi:hypothetical protein|nr:hypothetical protein [Burkholderiales bacterium]
MRSLFLIIISTLCLIQVSCVGDSNNTNNNVDNIDNIVQLSPSSSIPLPQTKNKLVSFMVATNNSENELSLAGIYTQDNQGNLERITGNNLIDASACSTLQANNTCQIRFYPQVEKSYLLVLKFSDNQGHNYTSKQLINVKKPVISENGFTYFKDNLNLLLPNHGKNTLSFPIVLDDNYKDVMAYVTDSSLKTEVVCANEPGEIQYTKGTMCTVFISGSWDDINVDKKVDQLIIKGVKQTAQGENNTNQFIQNLMITTSNVGNIITSAFNPVINPADGASGNKQLITLYNNGVSSVSLIKIYAPSPIVISPGTTPCNESMAAGSFCNFYVNVTPGLSTSGQAPVSISYNNSSNINLINLTIVYIVTPASPSVQVSTNGDFLNSFVGDGVLTNVILITNTGNITLNNLTFNNLNTQNSAMNYGAAGTTCVTGQSLAPNASCVMVIGYYPQTTQAVGNVNIYPIFSYTLNGTTQSYTSAAIAIAYSAVNTSLYVVVGDFGSVVSATDVATWVVNNKPPFVNNTIIGQAFTQGESGLYVLGLSATNTGTLYTSPGGIIWNVDPSSPGALSVLSILYDGINYIVAGGISSRSIVTNPTVFGGTWVTRVTAAPGSTINNLFKASNGYIATLSTAANLLTSINGTTWTTRSVTGNYFTSLWDGSTYYAFGTAGACASSNILTTWTRRANIATTFTARGSVYNNGLYVVVGSSTEFKTVYTTTNPQSVAWTARMTPVTTQLNSIVYAKNQYVTVGNAGVILTSPDAMTWTRQAAGETSANLMTVYYDGTYFWAVGTAIILVSTDGINWSRATLNSITYNGTNYIAVGSAGLIHTSPNLTSWTNRTSGTTNFLRDIQCVTSNFCMTVGDNGIILTTNDGGITWTTAISGTTANLMSFTCGLNNCVAVGVNGSSGVVVSTVSLASSSWNIAANTASGLNSVSYLKSPQGSAGNLFVAVGAGGSIVTSPDGVTWTTRTSGKTVELNSVTCSNGTTNGCIAVGNSDGAVGVILTSLDAKTWIQQTAGVPNTNLNSVVYYGGNCIIAGDSNTLLTSPNCITWTARTSNITATTAVNLRKAIAY